MKCIFAFSLAIVVTQALQLDTEWERFKVKYAKRYSTESEHDIRKAIFADNLRLIAKHNAEEVLGLHSFSLGVNNFADLTNDEFVQKFASTKLKRPDIAAADVEHINFKDVLPNDNVDWRQIGAVTPVKDQGRGCWSSWAFSATGTMEGAHFVKTGKLVSLSEQNLMDCGPIGGCTFDLPYDALLWTINNGGIDTEVSYPYTSSEERICRYSEDNIGAVITDSVQLPESEKSLQKAVSAVGPVSVGINASLRSFHLYHAGVYSDKECSSRIVSLFVLVVGYGTSETGEDYWIVKNSWGASWGMDGYILIAKDKGQMCGIGNMGEYAVA